MSRILESVRLRHLSIKNRLARSAVHSFLGNMDGSISDAEYAMYEELAEHGVGLIITGHCSVSPKGMANDNQTAIYADAFIAQFKKLMAVTRPYDTRIVVQINHAGPRAVGVEDLAGVSAAELKKGKRCRALTLPEIEEIVRQFVDAAHRLQQAGVDGVQIHAAHSYLLSQFIDETFNQRTDAYGGKIEGRFRIVREIIEGIKAKCGEAFPVLIKINADTATNDDQYARDLVYILQTLSALGVEAAELSGCDFISQPKEARLYYLERARKLSQAVDLPILLVGGVRTLADMDAVLAEGIHMVSLGRPLICESDLLPRLLNGQERSACLGCNRCFALPKIKPGIRCVLHRKR